MDNDSRKQKILKDNFINVKDMTEEDFRGLTLEGNKYFFDTENAPIFPEEITEKYNLREVEYTEVEDLKLPVKTDDIDDLHYKEALRNCLFNTLLREHKISTSVYMFMFGCDANDKVYWGNTIQEYIDLIERLDQYKIRIGMELEPYVTYVHNLGWDIEFFKYWFRDNNLKQIRVSQSLGGKNKNKALEYAFDITETDGMVHGARIQLSKHTVKLNNSKAKTKKAKKQKSFITTIDFRDSAKITPMKLSDISKDLIKVDDIYIKNSEVYQYNIVRTAEGYQPTPTEAWYCYCDIYLLKEWWNQFIVEHYIANGIEPFTISQIAFDSILQKTYEDNELRIKYTRESDKKELTDRQVYERHFALGVIEKSSLFKEYFRLAYKGGHTTASKDYRQKASTNTATISGCSMDITSSYPHQMTNKPLPFGMPEYNEGKYKDYVNYKGEKYDFHFITIAFDGFMSINPANQFGLNLKLRDLTDYQKAYLDLSSNESPTHNVVDGEFVGKNRIKPENPVRKMMLDKIDNAFIVTLTSHEYEEWIKNFKFFHFKKGKICKGVKFIDYVSCQSEIGHYAKGLDYFFKEKEAGDLEGNKAKTLNAKLIINSFYGKHCSRRDRQQKFYDFTQDVIRFQEVTEENENVWEDPKLYAVQYGAGVTSWGRIQLRETCRKVGQDKFIYADTDSLKFEISKEDFMKKCKKEKINISYCKKDKHLGWWDFEFEFQDFKAVGQKKYMYAKIDDKTGEVLPFKCKCAGLPAEIRSDIKEKEQFAIGKVFNKISKKKVPNGNLLVPTSYSLTDLLRNS